MMKQTQLIAILMVEIVVKQSQETLDVTRRGVIVTYLVFRHHLFLVTKSLFQQSNLSVHHTIVSGKAWWPNGLGRGAHLFHVYWRGFESPSERPSLVIHLAK